jgi:hypothetical protein
MLARLAIVMGGAALAALLLTRTGIAEGGDSLRLEDALFSSSPVSRHLPASAGRPEVRRMVEAEARRQGVPVALAHAVTHVESRFRCNAIGIQTRVGRGHGPLQIMPGSARALGFVGDSRRLATCDEGLRYGMKHLAKCWELSGRSYAGAATCHVQGPGRDPHRPVNAYARQYKGWVIAQLPAQPDALGWLSRGSVAAPWASGGGGA